MWRKINELSRQNLSQKQIAVQLGVCRDTVRHYQRMPESELRDKLDNEVRRHPRKLDAYASFITEQLRLLQFLSAPQIHDRLKEQYPDMPVVSERTVYNMVKHIREQEDLPKISEPVRQMSKVPDCEYGEKAQVDFGEKWLRTSHGRQVKVYFFVMVLQRSRYKFVYLQNIPFTSQTAVYAHHLAFSYFGGIPEKVIYDQDSVLLNDENYGDYMMTKCFAEYISDAKFEPVFCMAADPQSKGLVESCVKYVKNNFLSGRTYRNIEGLNEEVLGWLERTGNAKPNATTRLIPAEEFKEERKHLKPYRLRMEEPELECREYTVRKDNTLSYHGNFYSLPLGTYEGRGSKVMVSRNVDLNEIEIYDPKDFTLITRHEISLQKGKYITKDGHASSKSRDVLESEKMLRTFFDDWKDDGLLSSFLGRLRNDRPRYYRKTVSAMASLLTDYDVPTSRKLLMTYSEKGIYNANVMKEVALLSVGERTGYEKSSISKSTAIGSEVATSDYFPEKRSIDEYAKIINAK